MRKSFLLIALLLAFTACQYKELCYDHQHQTEYNLSLILKLNLDLDVELDVSDEAHTKIEMPEYMKVCFYDPLSGALSQTAMVGPEGGLIQIAPGKYNMVVYSFGTEWTWIRGENNIDSLEAYTSDITALKTRQLQQIIQEGKYDAPGPIIYTPDHLIVAREEIEIPAYSLTPQVDTISTKASTVVETYGFEVTNITGIEYIASVDAFVTNQARSTFFARGEKNPSPATIYFPLEVDREKGILKTTFNTFGKLPGESDAYLHILLTDTKGNVMTVTEDITEQFENSDHIIEIDEPIDIPKPEEGGGIDPTVEEWDEENIDIPIG